MVDVPDTKTRVLDAALESFGTTGYDGTSLDDLAGDLGLRKQTILYHFHSKQGLLEAVVDRSAAELIGTLESAVLVGGTGWGRIEAVVRSGGHGMIPQPDFVFTRLTGL